MANESKKNEKEIGVYEGTEEWSEDVRSLPMYNAVECGGVPCRGYLVGVKIIGGDEDPFITMIMKLTAPTKAKINDAIETVEAGKEIFIRGTDLRDLEEVALHPDFVREYVLTPRKATPGQKIPEGQVVKDGILHLKMKSAKKQPMPLWDRKVNPRTFKRSEVCPGRLVLQPLSEVRALLAQKSGDDSFDTSNMK